MKAAVVYSTLTGNTKKVAEAICGGLGDGAELFDVKDAPASLDGYDLVAAGFWVDRGHPDQQAMDFMKRVAGKKVFSFFTLGANPASAHAWKCAYTAASFYGAGCEQIGVWFCQGAIDPKLIERMRKLPPTPGNPHAATPEAEARWAAAASHPDAADLASATEAAKAVRQIVTGEDPQAELKAKLAAQGMK
ncbi:MAG: flavodoxin family protein [Kiritimatiellia bacterium]